MFAGQDSIKQMSERMQTAYEKSIDELRDRVLALEEKAEEIKSKEKPE